MADDLEKKMEPEISAAADKAEEIIKEEVSAVEEKAAEAVKETAEAAETAAAAVTAAATKEAEAAAKAAKKAEEQAAKEAAKKQAQAEKDKTQIDFDRQQYQDALEKEYVSVTCPNCGATANKIRKGTVDYCQFCGTAISVDAIGQAFIGDIYHQQTPPQS